MVSYIVTGALGMLVGAFLWNSLVADPLLEQMKELSDELQEQAQRCYELSQELIKERILRHKLQLELLEQVEQQNDERL